MAQNTGCSWRGPRFDSQHPDGSSQEPATPTVGDLTFSSGLIRHCAHVVHRCTPIHIKRNLRKRKKGGKEEERRERKKRKRGKQKLKFSVILGYIIILKAKTKTYQQATHKTSQTSRNSQPTQLYFGVLALKSMAVSGRSSVSSSSPGCVVADTSILCSLEPALSPLPGNLKLSLVGSLVRAQSQGQWLQRHMSHTGMGSPVRTMVKTPACKGLVGLR